MATRRDIRDAFYGELVSAATQTHTVTYGDGSTDTITVASNNISLTYPETESLPQIVYHEDYRKLIFNGVGTAPHNVIRDVDGVVLEERWREYVEAQFIVQVRASNEIEKEPIYEAVRTQFAKYQFDPWNKTDIHDHVIDIDVIDAFSTDTGNVEDRIRGDTLEIRISFYREYVFDTTNIENINTNIDADFDETTDLTYITT